MLRFTRDEHGTTVRIPRSFYPVEDVERSLDAVRGGITLCRAANDLELSIRAEPAAASDVLRRVFGRLNGLPTFGEVDLAAFRSAARPLVTCVILVTANEDFVREHVLPSIIENSHAHDIEIIVVYNGEGADLAPFSGLEVVRTEFGCVSKGYNEGVRRARGEYVATFHDDCMITDPRWIERAIEAIDDTCVAVSPEIVESPLEGGGRLRVAKNVPLVMRKRAILDVGGYDEAYYAGHEDLDFSYAILSAGQTFAEVDLGHRHFSGMSTIILLGGRPRLFRALFAHHIVPVRLLPALRDGALERAGRDPWTERLLGAGLLRFVEKFSSYLDRTGNPGIHALRDRLLAAHQQVGAGNRDDTIAHYRALISGGQAPGTPLIARDRARG